jgi:NAD(P)-dependent dehydrogenase (short-subunit alcohol dehydrogenase family)
MPGSVHEGKRVGELDREGTLSAGPGDGTALVVGGASGIGAAVADAHRRRGTTVTVWDVAGHPDLHCDVADPASVETALAATVERHGVPTWTTVTAGVGHSGSLLGLPVEEWDRVMAVNARGPLLVLRAVAGALRQAGSGGSLVVTSSVSAHLADRGMGTYCASKAALNMVVRVAAVEWAPYGIRVNAVAPGVTRTPMLGRAPVDSGWLLGVAGRTPLGRLGQPADIAEAALGLHGLDWVTGQIVDCDGGLSLHSPIDSFGEPGRPS